MGHFLKTMNPEAAAELEASVAEAADLPDVGWIVVYIPRPGEGRSGKRAFPALVMGQDGRGGLTLLVKFDVDDEILCEHIHPESEQHPWPAWRHVRQPHPPVASMERPLGSPEADAEPLVEAFAKIELIAAHLDRMHGDLYGKYEAPDGSIMEVLVGFETKLKELEQRLKGPPKKG